MDIRFIAMKYVPIEHLDRFCQLLPKSITDEEEIKQLATMYKESNSIGSILYHGSYTEVSNPNILIEGYTKDFGYGFYLTESKKQAEQWAKRKGKDKGIVSVFDYTPDTSLSMKVFNKVDFDWVEFIALCRSGKSHNYDVVEGPVADDTIYNFVNSYLEGSLSKKEFKTLCEFREPTHQIAFCSPVSIRKCLKFKYSYEVI